MSVINERPVTSSRRRRAPVGLTSGSNITAPRIHSRQSNGQAAIPTFARAASVGPQTESTYRVSSLISGYHDLDFVINLYCALLNRMPDPPGLNGYLGFLREGAKTRVECVRTILECDEYQARTPAELAWDVEQDGDPLPLDLEFTLRVRFAAIAGDYARVKGILTALSPGFPAEIVYLFQAQQDTLLNDFTNRLKALELRMLEREERPAATGASRRGHPDPEFIAMRETVQYLADGFASLHKFASSELPKRIMDYIAIQNNEIHAQMERRVIRLEALYDALQSVPLANVTKRPLSKRSSVLFV